ncbi:hypothetical protein FD755_010602 [Muntiacus reevesi]|uniref:G-protein coupled receptors family 1 profile domain-containing protein n=2 Tax=Muntiacus reevesi TaxID=9886 RepID=A0A5N3XYR3_MUNRE|nr:hypothetical protein FD755_010602 [Muntiacus reevesi]
MLKKNYTEVTEFILLGLTDRADLQPVLFVVFLVIYLITVIGNMSMILLIRISKIGRIHKFRYSHIMDTMLLLFSTQSCLTLCDPMEGSSRPGFLTMPNFTDVTEFILLGLTSHQELQVLFFAVFLVVYMITLIGNIAMIILISISPQLQSPMYFFLSHLSFVDVWFSSNVTPKMLENLVSETKTISYVGCLVQCYFFIALVHVEVYILAVMAFDRYMAICNPLLYGSKMSRTVCVRLISVPYIYGFSVSLICTLWTYGLYFCGNVEINHFYCADPPLIKIACGGVHVKEYTMIVIAGINFTYSLSVVLVSYTLIVAAVLRMRSADGRRKAFSTCGSHLTAVTMFYGTLIFMYLRRPTEESVEQGKMVAVFYTTVIPMLNPMIYSLRNRDVKEAVKKAIVKANLRQ